MIEQLALIPEALAPSVDHSRTMLAVKTKRTRKVDGARPVRTRRQRCGPQLDISPDPSRAKPLDEETRRRREMDEAVDLDEYLTAHPELRPQIRRRRRSGLVQRAVMEGDKPESLGVDELTRDERSHLAEEHLIARRLAGWTGRPKEFGDCPPKGPCSNVWCRHHLFIEVEPRGSGNATVKLNFPGREIDEVRETCSIRAAMRAEAARTKPRGPHGEIMTYVEVGRLLNVSGERAKQIAIGALRKLKLYEEELGGR